MPISEMRQDMKLYLLSVDKNSAEMELQKYQPTLSQLHYMMCCSITIFSYCKRLLNHKSHSFPKYKNRKFWVAAFEKQWEVPVIIYCLIGSFTREDCRGEIGEPSLLWESPLHASWTWAANCKFHSTSSMEGLSAGSLCKHLQHISIIVFTDSPEHEFLTAGSTKLFLDASSAVMLAWNC